ncbi:hypothetical protein GCM10022252_30010 [Streptosporangium oxazolinicum]|uniref:Protein kinase domain-containing protein n=1 Tax=Streptosporangium oxazolinicum TaxID=909287 RepID=A0ABP8AV41_9ACTN
MVSGPLRRGDPDRIGGYLITGRLGEGGQGVVYLGEGDGGEKVAIKVMRGGIERSFEKEVAAARQVAEFCTARVLAADLDHDPPYVASEHIDGPSLAAVVEAEGVVRGAVLHRLAVGTATALTAIHRAGVVHRDFKPGNVLIGPDGPRVIDFGIARLANVTATTRGLMGTPPYMAPEQFDAGQVGPATDVFAWGSTMTYAATGRPPFGGDTFAAIAYRILHGEPELGDLAEPLRSIVARCLAKDPARRPSARDVLLELLGEARTGDVTGALRQGRLTATVEGAPVTRRRLLLAGGVAATALAVTGGVFWRWGTGSPSPGPLSIPTVPGTPTLGGGTSTPAPASAGSTPAAVNASASAPAPSTRVSSSPPGPPPARSAELVAAVESAVLAAPVADFTFEGQLTDSDFLGTATGRLGYGGVDAEASQYGTGFDMRVRMRSGKARKVAVLWEEGRQETYLDARRVKDQADPPEALSMAEMVIVTASVDVILDLAIQTTRITREGRLYSGQLVTTRAPAAVVDKLSEITGGWTPEQLERQSTIQWRLRLDADDRPATFDFDWRALLHGSRTTSPFRTVYRDWRAGTVTIS